MPTRERESRDAILGARIRQRRRELGLAQGELARTVGISASYLNLIEWNKRRIAGTLLRNIAEALDLTLDELDGAAERRLAEALLEVAHLPALAPLGIEDGRRNELIGRFPGWARGIAALARAEQEASAQVQTLTDRLSNDPFLSEALHRMLTRIAAIRSAVEILTDYADLPPAQRDRFQAIIKEESGVLTDVGEALVTYLDKAEAADTVLTPVDEVEALFEVRENRFEEIEQAAGALAEQLSESQPVPRRAKALALCQDHLDGLIDRVIAAQREIQTAAARARAKQALTAYAVGALLLPMPGFAGRAAETRYDLESLSETYATDAETIGLRLTALPPGPGVPRCGYFRANAAGTIIERRGLSGLAVPRYAAVCPLWVLYRAQQSPEAMLRQRALFPSGARFIFVARARQLGPTGFGKPRHYLTDMVVMHEDDAQHTVYAPDPAVPVEEVGPSCRLCPRRACIHRVEDPFAQ